jgi:large subunit ribosomal protein L28
MAARHLRRRTPEARLAPGVSGPVRYGIIPEGFTPAVIQFRARRPESVMSLVCQVTGKKVAFGNRVSHANNKTKRTFKPNVQSKRFWLPSENRYVRLKVSAGGIRNITKLGIEKVVADLRRKGVKV